MTDTEHPVSPTETLNELLTRACDAEKGYEIAANTTNHSALSEWFRMNSEQRKEFANVLRPFLTALNAEPDEGTSVEAKVHQAFMKVKAAVVGQDDLALIEECRRGERTAMLDYKAALEGGQLCGEAEVTIRNQGELVLNQLKALDSIEAGLKAQ